MNSTDANCMRRSDCSFFYPIFTPFYYQRTLTRSEQEYMNIIILLETCNNVIFGERQPRWIHRITSNKES
jgi:hypothetical protein